MATERDLELLDEYLRNRLTGEEKKSFENQLQGDPDLKAEYQFQQQLVAGVKTARAAELKVMLNNIPVSSIPHGGTSLVGKIAAGTIIAGAVITGIYLYNNQNEPIAQETVQETPVEPSGKESTPPADTQQLQEGDNTKVETNDVVVEPKPETKVSKKMTPVTPPEIKVYDPTEEAEGTEDHIGQIESQPVGSSKAPSISVTVDKENRTYDFHYQFKQGKLFLYGPFESNLYELMEFFSVEKRAIFLYYADKFYLLTEGNEQIKALKEVTDQTLIDKLKESRSK